MLAMFSVLALLLIFSPSAPSYRLFYGLSSNFKALPGYFAFGVLATVLTVYFCGMPATFFPVIRFLFIIFACSAVLLSIDKRYFAFKYFFPLGALLNQIEVVSNGWRMPVVIDGDQTFVRHAFSYSKTHILAGPNTNLIWLSDCLQNDLIIKGGIVSIGDIILMLAVMYTAGQLSINLEKKPLSNPRSRRL